MVSRCQRRRLPCTYLELLKLDIKTICTALFIIFIINLVIVVAKFDIASICHLTAISVFWSLSMCREILIHSNQSYLRCQGSNYRLNICLYYIPRRIQSRMMGVMQLPYSFSTPFYLSPSLFTSSKISFGFL